jgi:hypothetical protein
MQELTEEGFLTSLTSDHKKILQQIRQHLQEVHKIHTRKFWNDWTILRFCRARKFQPDKIKLMIDKFLSWGKTVDFDNIGQLDMGRYQQLRKLYMHGYYNTDKRGRPIYIEVVKHLRADELFKEYTDEELVKYHVQSYQRLLHVIFPECSRAVGTRIESSCTIMDVKDVPLLSLFTGKVKAFTKIATDIGQDFFPEIMGVMFIINTGYLFQGLWYVVKQWMDVKTQNKIKVCTGSGKKELAKYIDP